MNCSDFARSLSSVVPSAARQAGDRPSNCGRIRRPAFPDRDDAIAHCSQLTHDFAITPLVPPKLGKPESNVPSGDRRSGASMLMPKTAVHEDCPAPSPIGNVGRTGKISVLCSESAASRANRASYVELRGGGFATHTRHSCRRDCVRVEVFLPRTSNTGSLEAHFGAPTHQIP